MDIITTLKLLDKKKLPPTNRMRIWRNAVLEQGQHRCRKCGFIGWLNTSLNDRGLCAHHIYNFKQYPEVRLRVDNGLVLCKNCHRNFHKLYGNHCDINDVKAYLIY